METAKHLSQCESLRALTIAGENLTKTGLAHVAKLDLHDLTLGDKFGNESLEFVNALKNLERLTVSKGVTSEFFQGLQRLPTLK